MNQIKKSNSQPILISTLELSGDEYAGWLIDQYKQIDPNITFIGLGGDNAKKAGMQQNVHFEHHASMAFVDVLKKINIFKKLLDALIKALDESKPKAVVLIDSSAFNIKLAKAAKQRGIPVLYLIPPKVWAWATWRVKKLQRYCDQIACMYAFETSFFNNHYIPAQTILHPRDALLQPNVSGYVKNSFAICPGSRTSEIKHNLPQLLDACAIIAKEKPKATFGLVVASHRLKALIEEIIKSHSNLNIKLIEQDQKVFLSQVEVALATSGTLTYELMLLQTPMVVVYRTSQKTSYYIVKSWLYKPMWVSLPNLIANRTIVTELLQASMTPENIAKETLKLCIPHIREDMVKQLGVLRQQCMKTDNETLGQILHGFLTQKK